MNGVSDSTMALMRRIGTCGTSRLGYLPVIDGKEIKEAPAFFDLTHTVCWARGYLFALEAAKVAAPAPQPSAQASDDKALIDWIERENVKIEPIEVGSSLTDYSVGWKFSRFYMAEPTERVLYTHYQENLRGAIRAAMLAAALQAQDTEVNK